MSEKTLKTRIRHAVKTESEWASSNPVLMLGEIGYVKDSDNSNYGRYKIGDGTKHWNELNYADKIIYDKIDEVKIGGRNYVLNSGVEKNNTRTSNNSSCAYNLSTSIQSLSDNTIFTYSFWARKSSDDETVTIDCYLRTDSYLASSTPTRSLTTDFQKFEGITKLNNGMSMSQVVYFYVRLNGGTGTVYVKNVKLEIGNKATDWTPAPEDKADTVHTHSASDITSGTLSSSRLPTVPVSKGGTGLTTITSGQVLVGNGTGNVTTRAIDTTSGGTSGSTSLITSGAVYSGLGGKANSDHTHDSRYYTESEIDTKLNTKLNTSLKGAASGLAELDSTGRVPSSQLPSYVDDVIEGYLYNSKFYKESAHTTQITGETGKIYVDLTSNKTYRWSGSAFVIISETLALGETSATAYRGDRGKIAYDHSQVAHAPSNAEVNQNAFSNVTVGSTTIAADSKTDTLTLVAGSNVTLTPDATNDKITISSTDTNNKVTQSETTTDGYRPLLLGKTNSTDATALAATVTDQSYVSTNFYAQPSTGTIHASVFKGNLSGNAATATKLSTARTIQTNLSSTSTASFDGSANITPGVTGTLPIANGGTGAETSGSATNNLAAQSLAPGAYVSSNEDLDDYITIGCYSIPSSSVAQTLSHTPITGSGFMLSVYQVYGSTSNSKYRIQIAMNNTGNTYMRCRNSSGVWGEWTQLKFTDTDTHYTSHLYVGASGGNANATSATSNPYLLCVDNTTNRNSIQLKAGSNMSISAVNGVVTFTATDTTYSVATTSANGLMSSTDKTKLDGIATGANNYTHPTSAGNKHIPSGGSSGQILGYSASGTAAWTNSVSDLVVSGSLSMGRKADTTVGDNSFAFGSNVTASGKYSFAGGNQTTSSGNSSFAFGSGAKAEGNYSIALGYHTTAKATLPDSSATAIGYYTTANKYQFACGKYNSSATGGSVTSTSSGTAFVIGNGTASSNSNACRITYAGAVIGKAAYQSTGADFAELREWSDGNPNAEDRRGYFVTMEGMNIRIASPGDYICGIISANPSVIGNNDEDWMGRYVFDDFGAFVYEDYEEIDPETGETRTFTRYKENPEYDPTREYEFRADRPEWDYVGLCGVIHVRDDGTCQQNGFCKCAAGGIATASERGYRVLERVNDHIVKVLFYLTGEIF